MDQSLQILSQLRPIADDWKNTPITVSELRVAYDYTHNREALILICANTSPLPIRSLYFDLDCYDDAGDLLGKANGVCMRNLDAKPNTVFGEASPIVIPYLGTCKVNITLQKVVFCDNSVWRCGDALPNAIPAEQSALSEEPAANAPAMEAEPVSEPTPAPIPAEWQNPAATLEGYRAAITGHSSLDHPNAPYLIKKFTALAEQMEAEAAEKARKDAEAKAIAEKDALYRSLVAKQPRTIEDWQTLAEEWKSLGGYKDAPKRNAEALKKVKSMKTAAKRIADKEAEAARIAAELKAAKRKARLKATIAIGITLVSITAIVLLFTLVLVPASKQALYDDAEDYLAEGKYTQAIQLFEELGDYADSKDRVRQIKLELTGNPDALFYTTQTHPGYSIENGILTFDKDQYELTEDTVRIPDYFNNLKVEQIAANFFQDVKEVKKVILPPGVTAIGESAFDGCTALTAIEAPGLVSTGNFAFRGCTALTAITLPDTLSTLGEGAFQGCTALRKAVLPEGIRALPNSLFLGCTSLTEVKLSSRLIEIGDYAFANCTALTTLTLPDSVAMIGNNTFLSCSKLSKLDLPDDLLSIGDKAFGNCASLTSIDLGNKISKISARTFSGCHALAEVTLPSSITAIGYLAFENCTAMKTVRYAGSADQWAQVEIQTGNDPLNHAKLEWVG